MCSYRRKWFKKYIYRVAWITAQALSLWRLLDISESAYFANINNINAYIYAKMIDLLLLCEYCNIYFVYLYSFMRLGDWIRMAMISASDNLRSQLNLNIKEIYIHIYDTWNAVETRWQKANNLLNRLDICIINMVYYTITACLSKSQLQLKVPWGKIRLKGGRPVGSPQLMNISNIFDISIFIFIFFISISGSLTQYIKQSWKRITKYQTKKKKKNNAMFQS